MVSMILTIAIGFAGAIDLQPASGQKVCIARKYDQKHMKDHKGQKLNAMTVIIGEQPVDVSGSDEKFISARVIGERNGKLYGNEAGCQYLKDGSVKCSIDCDGGAFNLTPTTKEQAALFTVAKDYYFPLFVQGADPENYDNEKDVLRLDYNDLENRTYKLYPAELPTCEQEWEKYKSEPIGC